MTRKWSQRAVELIDSDALKGMTPIECLELAVFLADRAQGALLDKPGRSEAQAMADAGIKALDVAGKG
jgi:hypothetical protein